MSTMDKVGVAGAILISPFSMYHYDASYAVEVQRAHPEQSGRYLFLHRPWKEPQRCVWDQHCRGAGAPGRFAPTR